MPTPPPFAHKEYMVELQKHVAQQDEADARALRIAEEARLVEEARKEEALTQDFTKEELLKKFKTAEIKVINQSIHSSARLLYATQLQAYATLLTRYPIEDETTPTEGIK